MIGLRFIGTNDFVGNAIKAYTWSWCTHVDVECNDFLIGAVPFQGVRKCSLDTDNKSSSITRMERYRVDLTPEQEDKFIKLALAELGKPYDYTAILGILLHRNWEDPSKWFCSEYANYLFKGVGRPLLQYDGLNCVTPRDTLLSPIPVRVPV